MDAFLHAISSFPTVPLTVLLGIVVGYWIFALVSGAAFHGGDAVSGGIKAAGDATTGAIKGAGEAVTGALKGSGDAVAEAISGDVGADADHDVDGADAGVLGMLGLGRVPITITLSVIALVAWTACTLLALMFAPSMLLVQLGVLVGSLFAGLLGAAVLLRPLGKALNQDRPARRRDSIGQICTITSGRVDASFGTAAVDDGAAGLIVHVVCPRANTLKKGDRAILIDFDPAKDTYEIEPIDWLMPQEIEALNDPARAAQILSGRVRRR